MEESVAAIWRRVLMTEQVSLDDNFFDVGGSSILLIAVRTGLQERLRREIPITWMFECTTIRTLAARLAEPAGAIAAITQKVVANARRQREALARVRGARSLAK